MVQHYLRRWLGPVAPIIVLPFEALTDGVFRMLK
jgi:hypothetical protein